MEELLEQMQLHTTSYWNGVPCFDLERMSVYLSNLGDIELDKLLTDIHNLMNEKLK